MGGGAPLTSDGEIVAGFGVCGGAVEQDMPNREAGQWCNNVSVEARCRVLNLRSLSRIDGPTGPS
jgi:hypothetical protein